MAELDSAKAEHQPSIIKGVVPGTWRWLCAKYFAECADYLRLDERTKYVRRSVLEATFDEPIAPGSPRFFRDMPLTKMTEEAVEVLRDRKVHVPEAANARVKAIRQVFKFGVKRKFAPRNPARDVEYFKSGSAGSAPGRPRKFSCSRPAIPSGQRRGSPCP